MAVHRVSMLIVALTLRGASAASVVTNVASDAAESDGANPIRRVVNMLQMMQKKVMEEGKKEEELFDKFMCYCKTGAGELQQTIDMAENKVPQLESALKEAEALKEQLKEEIKGHIADRDDAKDAVKKATGMREKEAKIFAKQSADYTTNINAMSKAVTAISKGMFLQTSEAKIIQDLTIDMDMSSVDRDMLSSFLATGHEEGYVPQSGQIVGILNQMLDTMKADLKEITDAEDEAKKNYETLVAAKTKEINANQKALESKMEREGQTGVEIVNIKEDLGDTGRALVEDKKYLADLSSSCKTKQAEFDERVKTRAEELLAIADTIKILNDDDALELFKKTLPSPSLLQTEGQSRQVRQRAVLAIGASLKVDPRLRLITLALKGKSKGFEKVLKMIDNMVALLGEEQTDDNAKKEYCEKALDKTEDDMKVLDQKVKDLKAATEDAKGNIETLGEEIKALEKGLKDLDASVTTATEQRKAENEEYKELMASNTAAKDLLMMAKNRLAKFYAPKLYKPPPKKELSAAGRIEANMAGGAVLVQVESHIHKDAPPPPPETWGAYQKKGQEHSGVIQMVDMLAAELDKEMTEAKVEETNSQEEYEEMMSESSKKRLADTKSLAEKKGAKADLATEMEKMKLETKSTMKEMFAKMETNKDLHNECDWLLQNFDARKLARAGEIDALKKAKAILSGADFSLVQLPAHLRGARSA